MNNFLEALKEFGGYAGAGAAIIGFVALVVKPIREKIILWIKGTTESDELVAKIDQLTAKIDGIIEQNDGMRKELDKQSNALQASLRNSLLCIYRTHMNLGHIPLYERENFLRLYEQYKNLNGNSFICSCKDELCQLPIKDD